MCKAIKSDDIYFNKYGDSMFNFTFIPMNEGDVDEYIYDGYLHFYKIDITFANKYNTLISKLLISQQNEKNKIQDLYNKKPKHVPTLKMQTLKMQTLKSPRLKSPRLKSSRLKSSRLKSSRLKSSRLNFLKSKPSVLVGGRHIINIKKHKRKKTRKQKKKK